MFFLFFFLIISFDAMSLDAENVAKKLKEMIPGGREAAVSPSPIPGLLQVVIDTKVFYVSEDLNFLMRGELVDLNRKKNMTEEVRSKLRSGLLKAVNKKEMITFNSKKEDAKDEIFVFTDIDCTYCRKFHLEVPKLNLSGISVHYLAFPRKGTNSLSSNKAQSAWCALNPSEALTQAKLGKDVPSKTCQNPIEKQFQLGLKIGVMGTPAIYASNGEELGGYLSARELLQKIIN